MGGVRFKIKELRDFTVVHFELEDALKPDDLKTIEVPKVNQRKGVIISGKGPIWFYCFLVHQYHTTKFIAAYDPRLGAVVVSSHVQHFKEGDVIDVVVEDQD